MKPVLESYASIDIPASLGSHQRAVAVQDYTTFRIGGRADILAQPQDETTLIAWVEWARSQDIPFFILGGGSNLLVSDRGIRGLVIMTSGLHTCRRLPDHESRPVVEIDAGTEVSQACRWCCQQGLAGLDFLYAMPGSIGGALWMNARCYGSEIAAVLQQVRYYVPGQGIRIYHHDPADWDYKLSPFQRPDRIILSARFVMQPEDPAAIQERMQEHEQDRIAKGHFRFPSAGSTFKNNYDYGKPTGKIIDELGLRGHEQGGARIAPYHGNIFINTGSATAADVRQLISEVQQIARQRVGVELEPEVLFVGDWPDTSPR
ncbi:UDP-N-acetylmuramate dehydrogenase [Spirochaeta africana]|uniref:UDP-N-acetylenolpyruvoylglucosamine reductase n=1 Tax=Spirochaeta africana (strain ATCC 700263 / DSM 8902 / Z-7692) TaxID=889378 RepID=H9ULX8_SPIAZ|nr:UDP-N-acetylmuramate dehydrogenase [Spirochaeta africana]AFG38521.1 UDP-N-acetylenolpyruvoylglucosamine reductase [Spirochaeta africana DSM 8902]